MIGVVGPESRARDLAASIDGVEVGAAPVEAVAGDAGTILDRAPDVVVAVGEAAASELVRAGVDVPVLPVDAEPGLESVAADRARTVLRDGLDGGFHTRDRPVLEATVDDETAGRGLFDVTLVTSEPARISEYAVAADGWTERFRADGVVVSTPAGSRGYARAVGGPVLDDDASALAVVPVAAFALRSTVRVADAEATLALSVERDEGDVSLLVDGRERRLVPPGRPVTVRVGGAVQVVADSEA